MELVSGPVQLATPVNVRRTIVETAEQMQAAVLDRAQEAHIYISAAAISDYRPEIVPQQKIKKTAASMDLHMVKSTDVLAEVAALQAGPFTVGFAAETEKLEEHALSKLEKKKLDMIVGNLVGGDLCFDQDENSVLILWHGGREEFARMSKAELATRLITLVAERYREALNAPTPLRQPTVLK